MSRVSTGLGLFLTCLGILPACMFMYHVRASACGGQKMMLDSLRRELHTAVSCSVGAGNGVWFLWKINNALN